MRRALFSGTFDPFTRGHASIVERALQVVDEVVIAIASNEDKRPWLPIEKREELVSDLYKRNARVSVRTYSGLTTDFAREVEADIIVRGVRTIQDFEYERVFADINRKLGVDTILFYTEPELAFISSSAVRELVKYGKDVSGFLPEGMTLE